MKRSIQLTILGLFCLLGPSLAAVLMTPLSIGDLTAKADWIVRGTVSSKSTHRDTAGRIYTRVELQVADVWKGGPEHNPLIVVHGGGVLGEERVVVSGQVEYRVGEEVVAFLVRNSRGEAVTLGLAQGKFQVWKDEATGRPCVRNLFHGGPEPSPRSAEPKLASRTRLTLGELRDQVRGALR